MSRFKFCVIAGILFLASGGWAMEAGPQVQQVNQGRVTVDHGDNPNGWGGIDSIRKNVNGPKVVSKTSTPPPPGGTGTRSSRP